MRITLGLNEKDHTLYFFIHTRDIDIFKRAGSITKLQKAMGHSSIIYQCIFILTKESGGGRADGGGYA